MADSRDVGRGGDERSIPIIQEEAFVEKRMVSTEHVRVQTSMVAEPVVVRDTVARETVEVTRVAIGREVDQAPAVREVDGVTIIPVIEERAVVEKRLFLVEEIHVSRTRRQEPVELPMTLRRTQVDVDRTDLAATARDASGRTD